MKRFGRLLLDPAHVLAVTPLRSNGITDPENGNYAIHFFNGTMAIVSATDAVPLIDALVPTQTIEKGEAP